jgi:hypothetical protein
MEDGEAQMFIALRQFRLEEGADIQDVIRRIRAEVVPALQKIPGFTSYRIVDFRNGAFGSMSVYKTEQGASQANRVATEKAGLAFSGVLTFTSIKVWRTLYKVTADSNAPESDSEAG